MPTADLITDFLGNEMSPERERQFLLSVAASDALRLELKSHLMVDRILGERVQSAHVPETVRSTIFAAAGVSTGHAAPDAPTSPAPAVDRVAVPRASFFSRLSGRVTLVAAACAFFGAGYFVGNESDATRAADTRPASANVASRPAPSVPPSGVAESPRVTPRLVDEPSSVAGADASPARSRNGITDANRPVSRPEVRDRAARPSTVAPSVEAPTTRTDAQDDPRPTRTRPRRNAQQTIGVETKIDTPTQEQREQLIKANPLDNGEPPVR